MQDFRMETFLMVCRFLNYTNAAKALNITQPAVSQHIRFLEEHYKVKLFLYEGKKLRLTEAGAMLYNAATTMKHDEVILSEQLKTSDRLKLIFGATLTIGDFVLPEKLIRFLKSDQDAEIRMLVGNTETLLKKINTGELDFAVVEGYFYKAEYDYKIYSRQRYIAVCGGAYVFKQHPRSVDDLFCERIILREPGSGTREILERYLEGRNCSVRDFQQRMEIGSISAIKLLVSAGCGITFLYEAAVRQELQNGTLREIPLADFDVYNNFSMVWRKGSIFDDRYIKVFDDFLLKNK
jgi:LysR family transcriptional regulator, transcriptional activator of the cysJI operon